MFLKIPRFVLHSDPLTQESDSDGEHLSTEKVFLRSVFPCFQDRLSIHILSVRLWFVVTGIKHVRSYYKVLHNIILYSI